MSLSKDGMISIDSKKIKVKYSGEEISIPSFDESNHSIAYELTNVMVKEAGKGDKITITHELNKRTTFDAGDSVSYNPKEISVDYPAGSFAYKLTNAMVKSAAKGDAFTITHELGKGTTGSSVGDISDTAAFRVEVGGHTGPLFSYELKNIRILGVGKGDKITITYELSRKTNKTQ